MRILTAPSAEIGPAGPRVRPLSCPVVLLGLCSWSALLVVLLGKDVSWDLLNYLAIVTLPAIVVGLIYGLVQGLNGVAVWLIGRAVLPVAEGVPGATGPPSGSPGLEGWAPSTSPSSAG